jgi:thiol-disulfide isomerase/thioredoxin
MKMKRILFILLLIFCCNSFAQQNATAVLDSLKTNKEVNKQFLFFWTSTCPNCDMALKQMLKKIANIPPNALNFITISFDTDKNLYNNAIIDKKNTKSSKLLRF